MKRIDEIASHALVSEKAIESYLVKQAENGGGLALKYTNPNQAGFPDRLVMMPGGKTAWCELKSRGKQLRPLQEQRKLQLEKLGQRVYVADKREDIDEMLDELKTRDL